MEFVQQVKSCIHLFKEDELLVDLSELKAIKKKKCIFMVDRKANKIIKSIKDYASKSLSSLGVKFKHTAKKITFSHVRHTHKWRLIVPQTCNEKKVYSVYNIIANIGPRLQHFFLGPKLYVGYSSGCVLYTIFLLACNGEEWRFWLSDWQESF